MLIRLCFDTLNDAYVLVAGGVLRTSTGLMSNKYTLYANSQMVPGLRPLLWFISSLRDLTLTTGQGGY